MTVHTPPEAPRIDTAEPRPGEGRSARNRLHVIRTDRQVRAAASSGGAPAELVPELVDSLRPRLSEVPPARLPGLVEAALAKLGEPRVTTYLPILVERGIRDILRTEAGATPLTSVH